MFTFIKKLFGFDQPTMKAAGVQLEQAPYKVPEPAAPTPIPLVVEPAPVIEPVIEPVTAPVVEIKEELAKKARKPRTPSTKKAAPVKKAAAMKAAPKKQRSKKV